MKEKLVNTIQEHFKCTDSILELDNKAFLDIVRIAEKDCYTPESKLLWIAEYARQMSGQNVGGKFPKLESRI